MKIVLEALIETTKPDELHLVVPNAVLDAFGDECKQHNLVDEQGRFNDAHILIDLFCGKNKP
ncbi:MAG: hypothetical protein HYR71_06320 [Chloroflexi bacterium]|nr:hypothetical protein [Chloroflexota bacterium]